MVLYPPHQPPPRPQKLTRMVLVFEGEDVGEMATKLKVSGLEHRAKALGLRLVSTDLLGEDDRPGLHAV